MSHVFVVDADKHPLNPVHPGRARLLLKCGKAAVFKRYPFTLILKTAVQEPQINPLRIKIDPGSSTTGIAIVNDQSGAIIFAAELTHRGKKIKKGLDDRRAIRRLRRARHTRYRPPRFHNRRRRSGWLAPSLLSRVCNITTWVKRLMRLCSIAAISMELVRFDTQAMENPDIQGCAYQQGTLAGYELREYLLEKWGRTCAYCNKQNIALQIEHIVPRAKGGTDRVSNLTLSCEKCNVAKGTQDIEEFLNQKPDVLKRVLAQVKAPLKDTAAVNTTRWALYERLKEIGLPIECGSGGLTKFNRTVRSLPKAHWLDAANVGRSTPPLLQVQGIIPLLITATGHGNRQMCNVNDLGFPCSKPKGASLVKGFQTGDMVRAIVPAGLKTTGTHQGRVLVRARGSFDIETKQGRVAGVSYRYCRPLHRTDGYSYQKGMPRFL